VRIGADRVKATIFLRGAEWVHVTAVSHNFWLTPILPWCDPTLYSFGFPSDFLRGEQFHSAVITLKFEFVKRRQQTMAQAQSATIHILSTLQCLDRYFRLRRLLLHKGLIIVYVLDIQHGCGDSVLTFEQQSKITGHSTCHHPKTTPQRSCVWMCVWVSVWVGFFISYLYI
jgi:hypothetical protein